MILHCDFLRDWLSGVGISGWISEFNSARFIHHEVASAYSPVLFVLKSNVEEPHNLHDWNKRLVFVSDTKFIQGPKGEIPSLVGADALHNQFVDIRNNLLLFQSLVNGVYKVMLRIKDWEFGVSGGLAFTQTHHAIPHQVEGASQILNRITDDKCAIIQWEVSEVNVETDKLLPTLRIVLNADGVEVRTREGDEAVVKVREVLVTPINLEP